MCCKDGRSAVVPIQRCESHSLAAQHGDGEKGEEGGARGDAVWK